MTGRPHTLKPSGVELFDRVMPSRSEAHRFALHDLQAFQEAMDAAPFTLAELITVVRRYPRSLLRLAKS